MPPPPIRSYAKLLGLCLTLCPIGADAGGGPENVLLVYNPASAESSEIARYYARLRGVPACNLVGVPWRGDLDSIPVERFRSDLLTPILRAIEGRGLSRQIDYVVYSSGFPWRVRLHRDFADQPSSKAATPYASLTGATYLYQFIRAKSPAIAGLRTNWYVPNQGNLTTCVDVAATPSRGFRAQRLWGPNGKPVTSPGARPTAGGAPAAGVAINYMLSTVLAVTSRGRGNTVDEARAYLHRSAGADASRPEGTFYFVRNNDVRSSKRHACYQTVIDELRALGARAEERIGEFPERVDDALGIMTGTRSYDLRAAGVQVLPGAIGDNLTSYGGVFTFGWSQTPLTEMLRHGAAGASGTVFEPLAIQAKFALPTLFLHYRRGCSLAEAYYQSVAAPYQLLIVGDPLCQPWAERPTITMPGFEAGQTISGPVVLRPRITPTRAGAARAWDFFVDGRMLARVPPGTGLRVTPGLLGPGRHEVRAVAIGGGPIETQGRWVSRCVVPEVDLPPLR